MPREPIRTLRVPDDLWTAAQAKAASDGVSVSRVLVTALRVYAYGEPCDYLAADEAGEEHPN